MKRNIFFSSPRRRGVRDSLKGAHGKIPFRDFSSRDFAIDFAQLSALQLHPGEIEIVRSLPIYLLSISITAGVTNAPPSSAHIFHSTASSSLSSTFSPRGGQIATKLALINFKDDSVFDDEL
jgi:hypothetical protein